MERWQQLGFESFAAWQKETGKQRAKASYERKKAAASASAALLAAAAAAAAEEAETPADLMNVDPQQVAQALDENVDAATKVARRRARRQRRARRAALKEVHLQDHDQVDVVDHWLEFEMELQEALEELEVQDPAHGDFVLPDDPIDAAVLLGREHTLKQEQYWELNRRKYMKERSDFQARLRRYLPEWVEAFRCAPCASVCVPHYSSNYRVLRFYRIANKGPGSPDPVTWVYHPGMVPQFEWSDSALDYDLKILPFGFAQHHAPPPRLPPPAHERFWLTEEELADPGLRAQRLIDLRPHMELEYVKRAIRERGDRVGVGGEPGTVFESPWGGPRVVTVAKCECIVCAHRRTLGHRL